MSHRLEDIIKAVQRNKGRTLIETENGEVVAFWRREEIREVITLERNPDGSSPIIYR